MPPSSRNIPSTAAAFQFLCSFFVSPFNSLLTMLTAGIRRVRRHLSCSARLQLIDQFNRIFVSAILILQSFLQLKYQGIHDQSQSPFSTHPITMLVAVASTGVYFLAYGAMLRFPLHRFASLAHHVLLCSGCIFVASLAAVTLPDTAGPFVYAVFGVIAAAGLLYFLYREEDEAELPPFLEGFMRRLPV